MSTPATPATARPRAPQPARRAWAHAPAVGLAIVAAAAASLAVLVAFGLSATWIALIGAALAGACALFWSRNAVAFLLCTYFFTLPIVVTKAIVRTGGVYTPGLELSLPDLSLIALGVVWLVRSRVLARSPGRPLPGAWVVRAYFAWMVVCAVISRDLKLDGPLALVTILKFIVSAYLVADLVRTAADVRRVIMSLAAGLVVQLAMAAAQFVTKSPLALQGAKVSTIGVSLSYEAAATAFRPSGFLLHPIVFAAYLVMVLPIAMVFITVGARRVGRAAWVVSVVLLLGGIGAIVTTLSRGAWIVFACSTVFMLVLGLRRGLVARRHIIGAALAVVLGPATVLAVYPTVWYRLTKRDFRSVESRLLMMEQAEVIIRDSPWVGVGLAGYSHAARRLQPPSFGRVSSQYRKVITRGVVHNAFLLVWAERGIVGVALTLALYLAFFRAFFRVSAWADPTYHAVAFALVVGLFAQLTFYMFDHFYMDMRPGLLWPWFGLLTAMLRINDRALRAPSTEPMAAALAEARSTVRLAPFPRAVRRAPALRGWA